MSVGWVGGRSAVGDFRPTEMEALDNRPEVEFYRERVLKSCIYRISFNRRPPEAANLSSIISIPVKDIKKLPTDKTLVIL